MFSGLQAKPTALPRGPCENGEGQEKGSPHLREGVGKADKGKDENRRGESRCVNVCVVVGLSEPLGGVPEVLSSTSFAHRQAWPMGGSAGAGASYLCLCTAWKKITIEPSQVPASSPNI